jgi:putative glutamine amidotransferase
MRPAVIGITAANGKRRGHPAVVLLRTYVDAILAAGGVPVLIPTGLDADALRLLYERLDGILLSGGGDVSPHRYGGVRPEQAAEIDLARDELEIGLVLAAAEDGKPFLGICRGAQVLNVALGGSLYTAIPADLPQAAKHDYSSETERSLLAHEVEIDPAARLARIVGGARLMVNSLHHQAVRDLAPGLQVAARSPDGVVEGLELVAHRFGIAVQWHPECLPDQPASQRLFRGFVEAAGGAARVPGETTPGRSGP